MACEVLKVKKMAHLCPQVIAVSTMTAEIRDGQPSRGVYVCVCVGTSIQTFTDLSLNYRFVPNKSPKIRALKAYPVI